MRPKTDKLPLDHSEGIHPSDARPTQQKFNGQRFRVTVILKPSELPTGHPVARKIKRILTSRSDRRPALTRDEYEEYQCADEAHVEDVRRFARDHGLEVVSVSRARHDVVLEGPASAMAKAFHVDLQYFTHA